MRRAMHDCNRSCRFLLSLRAYSPRRVASLPPFRPIPGRPTLARPGYLRRRGVDR
jgi:hypothetical protein